MSAITENYGPGTANAKRLCRGYKTGGDVKQDKVLVKKAVTEHENALHSGKHAKLRLKAGGNVTGKQPADRPDRRARGGKIGTVVINVKTGGQDDQAKEKAAAQAGLQKGVQMGAQMAASKMAGGPPPGPAGGPPPGPGPGGPSGPMMPPPPMGAGPGAPPPMVPRARGGKVPHLTAGAGSGLGRIEKANAAGDTIKVRAHERRRGGPC